MRYIKPEIVRKIFDTMDIIEIVSDYVTLKKRGANYWAKSPFANERTPSFSVNATKGIYKCFSTGKGGNGIGFLIELEGYTYPEALEHVAKKYGIEIPEDEAPQEKELQMEAITIALSSANDFFQLHQKEVQVFIAERKILPNIAAKFQIGFAPNSWESAKNYLLGAGYSTEILDAANIISKSEKNGNFYDIFRNRIIFPIHSQIGKIIGFGGRALNKAENAKYINTKETPVYEKSKVLYGLHLAKNAIRKLGYCILTEGYMDVVMMHQFGYENTVASSGTALTDKQAKLIRRFTSKVVLIYDGDAPGIKSAIKAINILIAEGITVEVVILPNGEDPDSFLTNNGIDAFNAELKKAMSFMDFTLKYGISGDTPSEKKEVIHNLANTISLIDDKIEAQLQTKLLSEKTGVDYQLIYDIVSKAIPKKSNIDLSFIDIALGNQAKPSISEIEFTEKMIIEVLVNFGDREMGVETNETILVSEYINQSIAMLSFFNSTYQLMRSEYFAGRRDFYNHNDDRVKMAIISLNTISTLISSYLHEYDSCDIALVFPDIVTKLIDTYQREWHQKMFTNTIRKLNYKDTLIHFEQSIVPLIEKANQYNEYQL